MRYSPSDFVDADDVARARSRSPHARQNCRGSMMQVNDIDVALERVKVECPMCLKPFDSYEVQKNRAALHPIIPSHLPDHAGVMRAEQLRKKATTADGMPRPY